MLSPERFANVMNDFSQWRAAQEKPTDLDVTLAVVSFAYSAGLAEGVDVINDGACWNYDPQSDARKALELAQAALLPRIKQVRP